MFGSRSLFSFREQLSRRAFLRAGTATAGLAIVAAACGNSGSVGSDTTAPASSGGGDWSEDRLVPDLLRALAAGEPVALRYPGAVRPWQHVLEPLAGYLLHAQALCVSPGTAPAALNFGPDPSAFLTVGDVVARFSARFGGKPGATVPPGTHPAEAPHLTLDSGRAAATREQSSIRAPSGPLRKT